MKNTMKNVVKACGLSILITSTIVGCTTADKPLTDQQSQATSQIEKNIAMGAVERPSIWVKNAEKQQILNKIETEAWAKSLYQELQSRVEPLASLSLEKRHDLVTQLPLLWKNGQANQPVLPVFGVKKGGGTRAQQTAVVKALQDGVDCGVMFYLTEQEKYASCGADILYTVINALKGMKVHKEGEMNSSWMFPKNHLYEARVIGAQLPVIYDFVHSYIKNGGQVYDVVTKKLVDFDFELAQNTFKTYIWLALNKGLFDSNWPVLESSSLVHNILALDEPTLIKQYLPNYTHVNTKHQASLKKVYKHFKNEGDIWPESLGYSRHVAAYSIYLMTLLDRYDSTLKLGKKYPNIPAAFMSYYDLQFPNEDYPFFGDGHRNYHIEYSALEMSYLLGKLNNNDKLTRNFGNYLSSSLTKGVYDRGHLHDRYYKAAPYYTPTQLLWYSNKIDSSAAVDVAPPRPRTKRLEFAGMNIQRNISKQNPEKNSLMAHTLGSSFIHGHASGIDMELYGQGHVLGVTGGKSKYRTDIHENYYRVFASHNTVISNGASASKGGWINLGINKVEDEAVEPAYGQTGVSPNHSFTTSSFYDEFNLVSPAEHQRTVALIRLSDTQGYYVDLYRAKSETPEQYHDYLYRNVADKLEVSSKGKPVKMTADPQRYQASASQPWTLQKQYRHPGWHFFKDVKSSGKTAKPFEVTFTASKLADKNIYMRALIPAEPAGARQELTQVMAPKSYGVPEAYKKKSTPTMVLRKRGDAWHNPFSVVYESKTAGEHYAVQSVSRLTEKGEFKGLKVALKLNGKAYSQYILANDSAKGAYQNNALGLAFDGRFAVITVDANNNPTELYIGEGSSLSYGKQQLTVKSGQTSGYVKF